MSTATKPVSNSLLIIFPYRENGIWRFDDARVGLLGEPFVGDVNEMINRMTREAGIKKAWRGFAATFGAQKFPGFHMVLDKLRTEDEGTWYECKAYGLEGWLCPALFKYFEAAPDQIYVRAEKLNRDEEDF